MNLWITDQCPDANGHHTIRPNDGSHNGDCEAQPIATVYDSQHTRIIELSPELHDLVLQFYQDEMSLKPPFRNEALCEKADRILTMIEQP